jgi:hypothetical protein
MFCLILKDTLKGYPAENQKSDGCDALLARVLLLLGVAGCKKMKTVSVRGSRTVYFE